MGDKMNDPKKIFPSYFSNFELPEAAREERILVYRACKTNKIEKASFLNTYEENGGEIDLDDPTNPSKYSLSTYEKPNDVKRFALYQRGLIPPFKIARGYTDPKHGLVLRTKERSNKKKKDSHVDWWLYIDAQPHTEFELIDDFKEYLENYNKRGE